MSFEKAIAFTRDQEGGWADDPNDLGGVTRFGISSRSHPNVALELLTWEGAREIYRRDYWDAAGCDRLPEPIDMVVFDAAVHSGVARSGQWLQKAVGARSDGVVGDMTVRRVEDECDLLGAATVALRVLHERRKYLVRGMKDGWFSRAEPMRFLSGFWKRLVDLAVEVGHGA